MYLFDERVSRNVLNNSIDVDIYKNSHLRAKKADCQLIERNNHCSHYARFSRHRMCTVHYRLALVRAGRIVAGFRTKELTSFSTLQSTN